MTVLLPVVVAAVVFLGVYALAERRQAGGLRRVAAYPRARDVEVVPVEEIVRPDQQWRRAERLLARVPGWQGFVGLRERAGVEMSAAALAVRSGIVALALVVVALGTHLGLLGAVLLVGLLVLAVRVWLGALVRRRVRAFDVQLPEMLGDLASALRAGHGFNQGLQAVADDAGEPARGELTRVLAEARLGRSLEEALLDLGRRIESRDLAFVLDAIVIQRTVGGSLAGIFELVAESVRQRQQLTLRVRALTAMGRLSAYVLIALPFVLSAILTLMQHAYLAPLVHDHTGRFLLGLAVLGLVVGSIWLRRIAALGDLA